MYRRIQTSRESAARTVALRQCLIEGVEDWAPCNRPRCDRPRCDRPVGPLTVVMETLPLGQASRTAAIAPRHGLGRFVPCFPPPT
jgi:hypothetical protein